MYLIGNMKVVNQLTVKRVFDAAKPVDTVNPNVINIEFLNI